jgi:hypothetical protein
MLDHEFSLAAEPAGRTDEAQSNTQRPRSAQPEVAAGDLASDLAELLARKPKLRPVEPAKAPETWVEDAEPQSRAAESISPLTEDPLEMPEEGLPHLLDTQTIDWLAKARRARRREQLRMAASWLVTLLVGLAIVAAAALLLDRSGLHDAAHGLTLLHRADVDTSRPAPLPTFMPASWSSPIQRGAQGR